ncbi:hypothetical protein [Dyadobacter sp. CY356]|uniref:hypothetical protein n=1 Tax=Dyadobacter sp. CY356 TaxID=2906442 RepID=UPI001F26890B|nr:hypothetical protein [Dyadobacter sp. CY356]MCF0055200.1 hypothetical protein [Dyadobacter sp. CY356]
MNDSSFETSGIRKMIIERTGIDIFKIEGYQQVNPGYEISDQPVTIHFSCSINPKLPLQTVMSQAAFETICKSDLSKFKAHFQKIASEQIADKQF